MNTPPSGPNTISAFQRTFIEGALEILKADRRVIGIAASGSYADDTMDEYSDIDLIIAVDPLHHAAVMADRQTLASRLGPLLASFTGEHVGEPRLLICLYGPPLLHVDLKFLAVQDAVTRVDDPVVLWERDGRLSGALSQGEARYPCPEFQWVEDRFWVWIHYAATKVGRGELLEAADFLSFLRSTVFGPLGKRQLGLRPVGVRRLETDAPQLAADLRRTIAAPERGSILAAIQVCVQLYRRLRSAERPIEKRAKAEAAALEYLARIEEGGETNS